MKHFLTSRIVLGGSLLALFGSGIYIGRMTAPQTRLTAVPVARAPTDSGAWMDAASRGLVKDLDLDEAARLNVRAQLEPVATAIFADQERALFQMHLRLLELHDTLGSNAGLDALQMKRLALSRAKLKDLIIRKFPLLVRANPSLAIGSESR